MKNSKNRNGGLVYSTNPDLDLDSGMEDDGTAPPAGQQNLRLWLERLKGDKKATVIRGFEGSEKALEELGRTLRQQCSCGGTAKDGVIILQGDVRDKAAKVLTKLGYKFKLAGG